MGKYSEQLIIDSNAIYDSIKDIKSFDDFLTLLDIPLKLNKYLYKRFKSILDLFDENKVYYNEIIQLSESYNKINFDVYGSIEITEIYYEIYRYHANLETCGNDRLITSFWIFNLHTHLTVDKLTKDTFISRDINDFKNSTGDKFYKKLTSLFSSFNSMIYNIKDVSNEIIFEGNFPELSRFNICNAYYSVKNLPNNLKIGDSINLLNKKTKIKDSFIIVDLKVDSYNTCYKIKYYNSEIYIINFESMKISFDDLFKFNQCLLSDCWNKIFHFV